MCSRSRDEVYDARIRQVEDHCAHERHGEDAMIGFGHTQAGCRCSGRFAELGLLDRLVEVGTWYVQHSGAENMKPFLMDLLPWDDEDERGYFAADRRLNDAMIEEAYLNQQTLSGALVGAEAWFKSPAAFGFHITVYVAGRGPH